MSAYEKNALLCKDPGLRQAMLENAEKERSAVWPAKQKKTPAQIAAKLEAVRDRYVRYAGTGADPLVLRGADQIISELRRK